MSSFTHMSRLVGLVLMGLIFTAFVDLPTWTLPLIVLDTPLTLQITGPWVMACILGVMVCAGTDILLQMYPAAAERGLRYAAPAWILPSMIATVGTLLIAKYEPLSGRWVLILVGTGVGLLLALLGEYHVADPDDPFFQIARVDLTVLIYAVALLVFTSVYGTHTRTALSGTATSLAGFLLATSLFRWPANQVDRRWPYALATAAVIGLVIWGLNHTSLDAFTGGGLLLLLFYFVTGIIQQFLHRQLTQRVLIEFAVTTMLGLLLLIGFGLR